MKALTETMRFRFVLVLLVGAAGCRGEAEKPADADAPPAGAPAAQTGGPITPADRSHPVVRIDTNLGSITVRLDAVNAPGTVHNFLTYVNDGFYNDTIIHYVVPGELIVAGGYAADRQPKSPRAPIRNEAHNGLQNARGTIAMTRDPALIDSATSQFFVNLVDAPRRDHRGESTEEYGYCVFGEVVDGLEVAERISQSPTTDLAGDLEQTPEPPVVIDSIRVVM